MSSNKQQYDVLIIGGGWAGISAAIKLIDEGKKVCVVEAGKELGGRARGIQYKDYNVDNGTHIMVGAYTNTLQLVEKIHSIGNKTYKENDLFERQALNLNYKSDIDINIPAIKFIAPINIIFSFLFASGLSFREKLSILNLGIKIKLNFFKDLEDINLEEFLKQQNQPASIIEKIWDPLCLAIMNTPINNTSTEIFLKVVKDAFFKSYQSSNILLFKQNLSNILPKPAKEFIEQSNTVYTNQSIHTIEVRDNQFFAQSNTKSLQATDIIIATAPTAAIKLLSSLNMPASLNPLLTQLQQFTYQPICTVYISYPVAIDIERTMQGFLGTTSQWLFHKSSGNDNRFISIIMSSQGEHITWSNAVLIEKVLQELNQYYPSWPQPIDAFVIREKRATFTASVNINRIRPNNQTEIPHLWLAGDYTNTQYPATLEGAVRSGLNCAKQLLAS